MIHPSIEKLRQMRLTGMARALEEQLSQPDVAGLSFDERLGLLGPEPGQPNRKKRIRWSARTQRTNPTLSVMPHLERLS
jgi:hypothetical protein